LKYPNGKDTMPMATTTLGKWGNSSAIRIPNHLLKQLNIEEGAEMEILLTPDI
jgi:antitoxin MazE